LPIGPEIFVFGQGLGIFSDTRRQGNRSACRWPPLDFRRRRAYRPYLTVTDSTSLLQQTILNWVGPLILTASEVVRVPAGIAGVYLLHSKNLCQGCYPPFYVGRSSDLHRRLMEHLSSRAKPRIQAALLTEAAYWSAAPVESPMDRARIESALIHFFRPACNDQFPSDRALFVNLPPLFLMDVFMEELENDPFDD
jgi:hypothetical protein